MTQSDLEETTKGSASKVEASSKESVDSIEDVDDVTRADSEAGACEIVDGLTEDKE